MALRGKIRHVQKAMRVYETIEGDFELNRMTALDSCALMAELALRAMGVNDKKIESHFSNGAGLMGYGNSLDDFQVAIYAWRLFKVAA